MKEDNKETKCGENVKYQYAWAGQIKRGCEKHARAVQKMADVMGMDMELQPIISDEPCMFIITESNV